MPKPSPRPVNTTGWSESQPLGPPPGVDHCDRLMDVADARDRAELIAEEARRRVKP
jgi:hypothetical protein